MSETWFESVRISALVCLANAINKASLTCAETVKPRINFRTDEENQRNWVLVEFEFLFFFLHLANRSSFAVLGQEGRAELQKTLGPMVVEAAIESYFDHWPQGLKDGLQEDFYENLNNSEIEYGACTEILPIAPFKAGSLFGQLAHNVAEALGNPKDPVVLLEVASAAAQAISEMRLAELVKAAGMELDKFSTCNPTKRQYDVADYRKLGIGDSILDLTEEEREEVRNTFRAFESVHSAEVYVHPEYEDEIRKAAISQGLWNYANSQVSLASLGSEAGKNFDAIRKAIAAIEKAYSSYPLPIYLYDLACFLEMAGRNESARSAFGDFLNQQSIFEKRPPADALLKNRIVEKAIADAESKVKR